MSYYSDKNELYHYGVPGMKWGVRKARKYLSKIPKYNKQMTKYRYKVSALKRRQKTATRLFGSPAAKAYDTSIARKELTAVTFERKMAAAKAYVTKVNYKIDKISQYDLDNGYKFCKDFTEEYKKYKW